MFKSTKHLLLVSKSMLKQYSIDQDKRRASNPFSEFINPPNDMQRVLEAVGRILRKYDKSSQELDDKSKLNR